MQDAPISLRTTQGHGVPSQYRPNHFKEWVGREDRRQARATSPIHCFSPEHSSYRSSLFSTIASEPLENRHDALGRSLDELRTLRQTLHTPGHLTRAATPLGHHCNQPLQGRQFLPHYAHHTYYGWNVPTPEQHKAPKAPASLQPQVIAQGTSFTQMIADKEQAVVSLQGQLSQLQQVLQEAERSKQRLTDMVTNLRDEVISKDLQLAAARQALQTSEADHELGHAQYKLRIHTLEQQIKRLNEDAEQRAQQLYEEAQASASAQQRAQQEQVGVQDAIRQQLLSLQQCLKEEQARVLELQAELAEQQAKVDSLQTSLAEKEAHISSCSTATEESTKHQQTMQQELAARDAHITELQQQVALLGTADVTRTDTQGTQLAALLTSFTELRASCQQQAKDICSLQADKESWAKEHSRLKAKLKQVAAVLTTVKADLDKTQVRLNQEIASHHATQMQLTLAQHRLREASIVTGKTAQMLDASLMPTTSTPFISSLNVPGTPTPSLPAHQSTHAAQQLLKALEEERVASRAAADALLQEATAAATSSTSTPRLVTLSNEFDSDSSEGEAAVGGKVTAAGTPRQDHSGAASQAALHRAQAALAGFMATLDLSQQQQQQQQQQATLHQLQQQHKSSVTGMPLQHAGYLEASLAGWRHSSTYTPGMLGGLGHGMDPSAVLAAAAAANRAAAASQAAWQATQPWAVTKQQPAGKLASRATYNMLNKDELARAISALLAGAGQPPTSIADSKRSRRPSRTAAASEQAACKAPGQSLTQLPLTSTSPRGRKPWLPAGYNP